MVDLGVTGVIHPPSALFPLKVGEKLAPPPRGGAKEGPVHWGCHRREGVAGAAVAVLCAAAHL